MDFRLHAEVKRYQDGYVSYRQIVDKMHGLTKKANICGFNLVEFVPEKDIDVSTALVAVRIVFNRIGALVRSAFFAQERVLTKARNALFMLKSNGERISRGLSNQSRVFHEKF